MVRFENKFVQTISNGTAFKPTTAKSRRKQKPNHSATFKPKIVGGRRPFSFPSPIPSLPFSLSVPSLPSPFGLPSPALPCSSSPPFPSPRLLLSLPLEVASLKSS